MLWNNYISWEVDLRKSIFSNGRFSRELALKSRVQNEKETFLNFELESHEYFQKLRRQIDIHLEEEKFKFIKSKIDTIAFGQRFLKKLLQMPRWNTQKELVI